jgi:CheY-like chemotaxis protein
MASPVSTPVVPIGSETHVDASEPLGPTLLLIAEDDVLICQDLKGRLESLGYAVVAVTTCAMEAVESAAKLRPDMVLMDINLDGEMDGIQAAAEMRRLEIPVVFVTGCCSTSILDRAVLTDPSGYVVKPYETSDLKVAVQVALHKHRSALERERLVKRLQDGLASVKTLSGRLSICAYCKSIKNNAGEWPQVEAYLMEHSHLSFTHGMCPVCFDRMKAQLQALEAGAAGPDSLVLG